MHNADSIHLVLTSHEIDAERAKDVSPPNGIVLVEMLPASKAIGAILLPDTVADKYRPDVGVVIARGPSASIAPGALVCVRPYDGQWIDGFDVAGYKTANQVRVYGSAAVFEGELQGVLWSDSIPLEVVIEDGEVGLVATNANLVIQRDPIVASEGALLLSNRSQYRTGLATILSMGPDCRLELSDRAVQVGDRIHYNSRGELDFAFGADVDMAIISADAVNFIVEGDVANAIVYPEAEAVEVQAVAA